MKNCYYSFLITTIACQLFNTMSTDEVALLSADLIQLADTLDALIVRDEICNNPIILNSKKREE